MLLCLVITSRECVRLALSASSDDNDVFASIKVQLAFHPDDDWLPTSRLVGAPMVLYEF